MNQIHLKFEEKERKFKKVKQVDVESDAVRLRVFESPLVFSLDVLIPAEHQFYRDKKDLEDDNLVAATSACTFYPSTPPPSSLAQPCHPGAGGRHAAIIFTYTHL